jgi:hypothetical protein
VGVVADPLTSLDDHVLAASERRRAEKPRRVVDGFAALQCGPMGSEERIRSEGIYDPSIRHSSFVCPFSAFSSLRPPLTFSGFANHHGGVFCILYFIKRFGEKAYNIEVFDVLELFQPY